MSGDHVSARTFCMTFDLPDGSGLALTSHDRDLEREGMRFSAGATITPQAIRSSLNGEQDDAALSGAVDSEAIEEKALRAGRWDGARMRLSMTDWETDQAETRFIDEGAFGRIEQRGRAFETEFRSPFAELDRPACPRTSPLCRAKFGDRQCRVDLAGRRHQARIVDAKGDRVVLDRDFGAEVAFGTLRWIDGERRGQRLIILTVEDGALRLRDVPDVEPAIGDRVEILEGCDKRVATCRDRFANGRNFRGEPHLPGSDLLTRYPGS